MVTSGPSSVWPKKAYRNPTDQLVKFLDYKHGDKWAIFEFRAEGTGYPDSEVYYRIHHFPWPDHHPPPFALISNLMASMRNWLQGGEDQNEAKIDKRKQRVAVVHCKAGKGRSGTVACSYLISQDGWKMADALKRFTERRMRAGFGEGVSIPSQLRYICYVDQWTNRFNKLYVERAVEIVEILVWGLQDGVKVSVEGYIEDGREIKSFHTFTREEKAVEKAKLLPVFSPKAIPSSEPDSQIASSDVSSTNVSIVQFKPVSQLLLPSSDVNIDFERRNTAAYTGWTVVTSLAHVWFNAYFEGGHTGADSGVFEIDWDAMDGIKGSARKGIRALDRLKVVWRYTTECGRSRKKIIPEPASGEPVPEPAAADWKGRSHPDETYEEEAEAQAIRFDGVNCGHPGAITLTAGAIMATGAASLSKELGLRKSSPTSANISRATSFTSEKPLESDRTKESEWTSEDEGVNPLGPEGEEQITIDCDKEESNREIECRQDTKVGKSFEVSIEKIANAVSKMKPRREAEETKKTK